MWDKVDYGGFEVHVLPMLTNHPVGAPISLHDRWKFTGFVCRPGVDLRVNGQLSWSFQSGEFDAFLSEIEAGDAGYEVGKSIVDGRHPTVSVVNL